MLNLIGDIHGQDCWKQLVREDCPNIFLGDYMDSKQGHTQEQVIVNFRNIIAFKTSHPETVLLYGNHDLNYLLDMDYRSRFSLQYYRAVYFRLFERNAPLFYGVAYAIDDNTLVSHAGVTKEWYEKYFGPFAGEGARTVAERINELWRTDKQAFTFSANVTLPNDHWGESPTHSPVWIRSWVLPEHNLFAGTSVVQIIGHTPHDDITRITDSAGTSDANTSAGIICIDCLHSRPRALLID